MHETKPKTQSLSVHLIHVGLTPEDFLSGAVDRIAVRGIGHLYFRQNDKSSPRWLAFFEDALETVPDLYGASNGAVLVVERKQRFFALTFGQGRHLLESGTWEENFGLRVTLNSVHADRLRSIERKAFDAIASHTRTQAALEGDIIAFGLNVEQDCSAP